MQDLKLFADFMSDYWQLIKTTFDQPDPSSTESSAYWKTLMDSGRDLAEKYNEDPFVRRLVLAYLDYQDGRQARKQE